MSGSRAAIRYAKATLDYAVEQKTTDQVNTDMEKIAETISENVALQQLLSNPILNNQVKKESLAAIFKGYDAISLGLINTLADNKRVNLLQEVALKYTILYEKMKGEEEVLVTTAIPLTEALEKKVLAKVKELTSSKVTLKNNIDQSIVGGFIIKIGDLQYDASMANKLITLKREFTNSL